MRKGNVAGRWHLPSGVGFDESGARGKTRTRRSVSCPVKTHHRILQAVAFGLCAASLHAANDWNRFRGPNGTGLAPDTGLPVAVDAATTLWKVPVDKGWSSPVLWGDILVITAETGENKRAVVAHAIQDGREL